MTVCGPTGGRRPARSARCHRRSDSATAAGPACGPCCRRVPRPAGARTPGRLGRSLSSADPELRAAITRGERIKELIRDTAKVKVVLPDVDDRTAALAAYDFADLLRLRRNEAAHTRPAYDFEHAGETEEFLVSAGRHLPGIWSLVADET